MKKYRNIQLDPGQLEELQRQVERIKAERKAAEELEEDDFDVEDIAGMKSVGDFGEAEAENVGDDMNDGE